MLDGDENKDRAVEAFYIELDSLVDRFVREWDLTHAAAIGVLNLFAYGMMKRAHELGEERDSEPEG